MNSFAFGFSVSLLVWTTSAICNAIAISIGSSLFRVPGILLPVLLSLSVIFLYTRWWTKKTSLLFYAAFFPNLVWNSYDFLTVVELWIKPSKGFLSEYVSMDEPLINNFWIHGISMFDGVALGAVNYIVLYLMNKGRSVRNWLLFISSHYGFAAIIWSIGILMSDFTNQTTTLFMLLGMPVIIATPLLMTIKEPEFMSKPRVQELIKHSTLCGLTKYLWIITLGLIMCKILIVEEYEIGFFRSHDYTMNLLEAGSIEWLLVRIHVTLYELVLLPTVLISLASLSGKWVPSFLWDLSVIQAGCFVGGQSVLIFGSLFWEMPPELRANPGDLIFWAINVIPIAASILQVALLAPSVSSTKVSRKGN